VARKSENKPTHITTDNIFEDIGFPPEVAAALKVKACLMSAIVEEVRRKRYTQRQLTQILDEHQPVISNLLRGEISHMSIEKLLKYANRLNLGVTIRTVRNGARRAA
jgi:predicted XRE-type DNA-binding protein